MSPFYSIPACYLNGNLATMLFGDALFYLLALRGERNKKGHLMAETNHSEMMALTGLTRRSLRQLLDEALDFPPPHQLQDLAVSILPHGRTVVLPHYDQLMAAEKVYRKPVTFVTNGWARLLGQPYPGATKKSRFPLTVLNRLLMKPAGRLTSRRELIERTRHPEKDKAPDAGVINEALSHLLALGLVEEAEKDLFRACPEQFNLPAEQIGRKLLIAPGAGPETAAISQTRETDPQRTELALRLARLGNFDLVRHFQEIFHTLPQFQLESDLDLLEYVIHRRRQRPPSQQRWHECVASFERALLKESVIIASPKLKLAFRRQNRHVVELTLPPYNGRALRWAKLVIWYEDGRFAFSGIPSTTAVNVTLLAGSELVWQRTLTYEDHVVRCDLTASARAEPPPVYRLLAETTEPSRHISLEAMLEAQVVRR